MPAGWRLTTGSCFAAAKRTVLRMCCSMHACQKYILAMMYFSVAFSIRIFLLNDHINLSGVCTCHFG
uniref:Uncharacterized protein n=1 Tax=Triticum urartu TaxID=4572 RepID=A0A8R7TF01_TRIUA